VVGTLALAYCLAEFLETKLYQMREAKEFANQLRLRREGKPAPMSSVAAAVRPEKHSVVGRLEIRRIGVSVMVVQGIDDSDLKRAAGHIPGTALPGEGWERGDCGPQGHLLPASARD